MWDVIIDMYAPSFTALKYMKQKLILLKGKNKQNDNHFCGFSINQCWILSVHEQTSIFASFINMMKWI